MTTRSTDRIHALLFGLSEDLAGELLKPLAKFCSNIQSIKGGRESDTLSTLAQSPAQIIFCGADTETVTQLRQTKPEAPIVVVSRHPEVSGWLDSIEAGATDYCAAPFETAQLQWILETSMRSLRASVPA
jgi:DNA-binding NarL/FixJ family response regulator